MRGEEKERARQRGREVLRVERRLRKRMQKRVMDLEKGGKRRDSMNDDRDQARWFGNGRIRPSTITLEINAFFVG